MRNNLHTFLILAALPGCSNPPAEELCINAHGKEVVSLAFSPDSKRAVSAALDGKVRVWDLGNGVWLDEYPLPTSWHGASVAFSPDGKNVLAADPPNHAHTRGVVSLWDGRDLPYEAELGTVSAAFSPDGRRLITGHVSRPHGVFSVRVWEVDSGKEVQTFHAVVTTPAFVGFTADGRDALWGGTHEISIRDLEFGREVRRWTPKFTAHAWAYAPNANRVMAGGGHTEATVCVWNTLTGEIARRFTFEKLTDAEGKRSPRDSTGITAVALSPDGRRALVAVTLCNGSPTTRWGGQQMSGSDPVREHTIFGSYVYLFEVDSGREITRRITTPRFTTALAFSPDGRQALLGDEKGELRLWKLPE